MMMISRWAGCDEKREARKKIGSRRASGGAAESVALPFKSGLDTAFSGDQKYGGQGVGQAGGARADRKMQNGASQGGAPLLIADKDGRWALLPCATLPWALPAVLHESCPA